MRYLSQVIFLLVCLAPQLALAGTIIDFEGIPDSTSITTQYAGVTFSNAVILSLGISLNEFEFPPHSGSNVVSDDGGPMLVSLTTPAQGFAGFFTYASPLTFTAFDLLNNQIASAKSLFSNNEALSGDPGSSPNERIELSSPGGLIFSIMITGDALGGSFALDDVDITPPSTSSVPEPGSLVLVLGATLLVADRVRHHKSTR